MRFIFDARIQIKDLLFKSIAIAVRFLTRRFIGEYEANMGKKILYFSTAQNMGVVDTIWVLIMSTIPGLMYFVTFQVFQFVLYLLFFIWSRWLTLDNLK